MNRLVIILFLFTFSAPSLAADLNISSSWGAAKKTARDEVYMDHLTTFYCECSYEKKGRSGGSVTHSDCGYDGSDDGWINRTNTLEWEHVVPAKQMPASSMDCWKIGLPECEKAGRGCCEKNDPLARAMIYDLHNIVPSIGQVNAIRGDKPYGVVAKEERELGQCDFEWTKVVAEPPTVKQGNVARIWLYMQTKHGLKLSPEDESMYRQWSCNDLPDQWEKTRDDRIKSIQGNSNPFIEKPCKD